MFHRLLSALILALAVSTASAQIRNPITIISGGQTGYVDTVIYTGSGVSSLSLSNWPTGRKVATLTLSGGGGGSSVTSSNSYIVVNAGTNLTFYALDLMTTQAAYAAFYPLAGNPSGFLTSIPGQYVTSNYTGDVTLNGAVQLVTTSLAVGHSANVATGLRAFAFGISASATNSNTFVIQLSAFGPYYGNGDRTFNVKANGFYFDCGVMYGNANGLTNIPYTSIVSPPWANTNGNYALLQCGTATYATSAGSGWPTTWPAYAGTGTVITVTGNGNSGSVTIGTGGTIALGSDAGKLGTGATAVASIYATSSGTSSNTIGVGTDILANGLNGFSADGTLLTNAVFTASNVVASAASFTAADVGKMAVVFTNATYAWPVQTTVSRVLNATQAVIAVSVGNVTNALLYGTDNTTPFRSAISQLWTNLGGRILLTKGIYLVGGNGIDQHWGNNHAIFQLPASGVNSTNERRTIEFVGPYRAPHGYTIEPDRAPHDGAIIFSPVTTVNTNRRNYVFGCAPTDGSPYAKESYVFRNLTLRTTVSPTVGMLDFTSGGSVLIDGCTFDVETPPGWFSYAPVNHTIPVMPSTTFPGTYDVAAVIMPGFGNNADPRIRDTDILFYPVAVKAGEHTSYVSGNIMWCGVAFDCYSAHGHGLGQISDLQLLENPYSFAFVRQSSPVGVFASNIRSEMYTNYVAFCYDTNYIAYGWVAAERSDSTLTLPSTTFLNLTDIKNSVLQTYQLNVGRAGSQISLTPSGVAMTTTGAVDFSGRVDDNLIKGYDSTYRIGIRSNIWRIKGGQGLQIDSAGSSSATGILTVNDKAGNAMLQVLESGTTVKSNLTVTTGTVIAPRHGQTTTNYFTFDGSGLPIFVNGVTTQRVTLGAYP